MGQVWLKRLIEYRRKYKQFTQGRYARVDALNRMLLIVALFFSLFRFWLPFLSGYLFPTVLIGIIVYRFLSKKIYPRLNENQKYLQKVDPLKKWFFQRKNKKNDKETVMYYTLFSCPVCQQNQRAPQGKGKIRVTCKKCGFQFETKV
ncbi:hypothetical protein AALA44_03595 [Enterococcus ratti]|uniref:hypothetical protein n=1 Tax=Enterococcus ratti TaxID=150033 RepID=UPI0035167DDC